MSDDYLDAVQKATVERELDRAARHPLDEILARPEHSTLRRSWEENEEVGTALLSAFQRCWVTTDAFEIAGACSYVVRNLLPWAHGRAAMCDYFVHPMTIESVPSTVILQDPRLKGVTR